MCRDRSHGGRRCERSDLQKSRGRINQLLSRYSRAIAAAAAREDYAAIDKYDVLLMNVSSRDDELNGSIERATKGDTLAGRYTVENTITTPERRLREIRSDNAGDPELVDKIDAILDWRDAQDEDPAEVVRREKELQQQWGTTPSWQVSLNPTDNLARSPRRRLTPDQQCREDYTLFVHAQYLKAEEDCHGVMVSAEGKAKGVDPISLFSGPHRRAAKYASEELQRWFHDNGRQTFEMFRYSYFNRDSDYKATQYARAYQGFSNAA